MVAIACHAIIVTLNISNSAAHSGRMWKYRQERKGRRRRMYAPTFKINKYDPGTFLSNLRETTSKTAKVYCRKIVVHLFSPVSPLLISYFILYFMVIKFKSRWTSHMRWWRNAPKWLKFLCSLDGTENVHSASSSRSLHVLFRSKTSLCSSLLPCDGSPRHERRQKPK